MCFVKLDAYQPFFFFGFSGGVKAYLRGLLFFFLVNSTPRQGQYQQPYNYLFFHPTLNNHEPSR